MLTILAVTYTDLTEEKRKLYANMRFTMEYTRDGDNWTYTVHIAPGLSKQFVYTIGQLFEATTFEGRPIIVTKFIIILIKLN